MLPVIMNSSTKVTTAMIAAASGTLSKMEDLPSTSSADGPVTSTSNGDCSARTSATSSSPAGETGSTDGTTESHVASPLAKPLDRGVGRATRSPST